MAYRKLKNILATTTMSALLLSSVIPYNVLAASSIPIDPLHQDSSAPQLTKEQIAALNQISIGGPEISSKIDTTSAEPVRVIVEFKQEPAKVAVMQAQLAGDKTTLTEEKQAVADTHKQFRSFIEGLSAHQPSVNGVTAQNAVTANVVTAENETGTSPAIEITREYQNALNGVAMTLPGTMVERLLDSELVSHVFADEKVTIDPIKPTAVSQQSVEGLKENSIPLPGIDALHNEGIKGNGVKVGVLDTGIDYNHPDLTDVYKGYRKQEGVNPNTIDPKSVKGWDFIDNDADPMETTYDDWVKAGKPVTPGREYPTYHGTHVSGTIAAQSKANVENPAQGVAPGVDLYVYRVLGPYGSGASSGIVAAIDKSVSDGMKVINMSLGAASNDPSSAEAIAVNNATLAGVTCVIAAGNAGNFAYTLGTPGAAALPITVGASDFPISIPTATATVGNETFTNFKLLGKGFNDHVETLLNQTYPVVFVGLGSEDDFKDANGQPIDLRGKIALIQRGTYSLASKIVNAQKAGAVAAIMYNNIDGDIDNYLASDVSFIPTFRMSKADGERLKAAAETASITFTNIGSIITEGNHLASFSSRGPVTTTYDIKPDVVAPGVSVYSTYPEYIHSPEPGIDYSQAYARISGTSMATPHVAGIAALILQAHPDYKPADVKAALMNSADKLNGDYSVYEVGAGEVDVAEAVHNDMAFKVQDSTLKSDGNGGIVTITYEKGALTFGAVYKKEGSTNSANRTVVFKNRGTQAKTFDITAEYSKPVDNDSAWVSDAGANHVTVTTSTSSVTVAAGGSTNVTATVNIPASAEMGQYEGYVNIVNHDNPNEHYRIPFATRFVEKGIGDVEILNPAITTMLYSHPWMVTQTRYMRFRLNSPMKDMWAIIYDKDGKALGASSLKPFSLNGAALDTDLKLAFSPSYYPFIGDAKDEKTDINQPMAKLPEGEYSIKLRTSDADAVRYEVGNQQFIIDNTLPKLTFKDHKPGVYELSDSDFTDEVGQDGNTYHAFWLHTNVYDEGTAKLADLGYTQSDNKLFYYFNQKAIANGDFPLDANGDTKIGIEPSDIENGPATIKLIPMDMARNTELMDESNSYAFVKKGTPYVVPTYDKEKLYQDETLTMTLNLNNVKDLMAGNYNVGFYDWLFQFQNVKVNPTFQHYADEHGLTVSVDEPTVKDHPVYPGTKDMVNAGAHISGGEDFKGISGDMPFLDVTFKLYYDGKYSINGTYDKMNIEENIVPFTYTQYGEEEPKVIPSFNQINQYAIVPKSSYVVTFAHLQAFYANFTMDYSILGAKAYAQLSDGTKVQAPIAKNGFIDIQHIPLSKDPIDIVVEAPGHLKSIKKWTLGRKTSWGEDIGELINSPGSQPVAAAGEVNGDGVIDVLDVKQVAKKFGVQKPTDFNIEDLNRDGIVNATDMNFLVASLYKANPDATITPKEMVDGKYATDYFNVLGLSTRVNTLKATTKTNHTATLNWLAAVDATNIKIEKSTDGITWTAATTASPVAVDSNTAVVTGLNENTTYKFRVTVTGGLNAGFSNVATATTDVTLPPNAPVVKGLGDNETSISGKTEPNAIVTVKKDENVLATGTANEAGDFTLPIELQKAGTVLTISVANAEGKVSEEVSITVSDLTAPNAPVVGKVGDKDTAVSGTTEANSNVVVSSTNGALGTAKADENGNYQVSIAPQKAGTVLTVTVTDEAGNQSKTVSITVLDVTAPLAPSVKPVTEHDVIVSGSTESNATVTVKRGSIVIGTETANKYGKFIVEIDKQKAGTVLTVSASDETGNVSANTNVTVLDRTAPNAPKINAIDDNDKTISGSAEANATITVKKAGVVVATGKATATGYYKIAITPQKAGTILTVNAKDAAGNTSTATSITVTDRTAPKAAIISKFVLDSKKRTLSISGSAEAGASVVVKIDNKTAAKVTVSSKGTFTASLSKLSKGNHTVTLSVVDKAGNVSITVKRTITVK
ncbi:Ig-like domain-containing protein [Bacillaceae bacterium C204]|uniref:Ig-like domain-containing protein n=1 Tax=Neobacillus sp. 204 TaxID=3383351 RepID=UPI00397B443A